MDVEILRRLQAGGSTTVHKWSSEHKGSDWDSRRTDKQIGDDGRFAPASYIYDGWTGVLWGGGGEGRRRGEKLTADVSYIFTLSNFAPAAYFSASLSLVHIVKLKTYRCFVPTAVVYEPITARFLLVLLLTKLTLGSDPIFYYWTCY